MANQERTINRVYFYYDKEQDKTFAIDNERQATHLHRRKDFNQKFEYIGWSDGATYKQMIRQDTPKVKRQGVEVEDYDEQKEKINKAFEAELQKAKDNPDKTPPGDFTKLGLGGKPMQDGMVRQTLNQMR